MYSTSGLFKESQVDTLSSIETDKLSDWSRDISILQGPEGIEILDKVSSQFGKAGFFFGTTALCFALTVLVEFSFFVFSILAGCFTYIKK